MEYMLWSCEATLSHYWALDISPFSWSDGHASPNQTWAAIVEATILYHVNAVMIVFTTNVWESLKFLGVHNADHIHLTGYHNLNRMSILGQSDGFSTSNSQRYKRLGKRRPLVDALRIVPNQPEKISQS